ncbi:EamA family transporter [Tuberibacillus sp. Marseille-P3662]|uniref:EamA family transporter n=1 Tax=Tuberibacillus sp. Marseille-P3662 TaxID=1965358 RepID=UPI000A1CB9BE|nr:DMT family transporter [Tuberibacillus sp. Marseille-P3662]
MKRWQAVIVFMIGAGSFGMNPVFVKLGFAEGYTLGEVNAAQMILAVLFLWLIGIRTAKKTQTMKTINLSKTGYMMVAGTLTGLTGIFYYGAMQYLPASVAIVLLFQFVWVGVLFEWVFDRKRPTKETLLSVVVTLIGVAFAADVVSGDLYNFAPVGILLGFCSAFSYTGFVFVSGRVAIDVRPLVRTPIMMTGSLILILIIFPPGFLLGDTLTSSLWLYGAGLALCGGILPPLLFAISAPHIPGSLATILGSAELPVAVVASSIILSERVTLLQWFGVILIIISVVMNEWLASSRRGKMRGHNN